ncbi:MAG: hypothetical protein AABY64_07795 [Bdellovibrionota bacterium]
METVTRFKQILMASLLTVAPLFASALGGSDGGGGDPCEDRFSEIRDDIRSWIRKGGPTQGFKLPPGIDAQTYASTLLDAFENTKVKCIKPTDEEAKHELPIKFCGSPKVCKFERSSNQKLKKNTITCDYNAFLDTSTMTTARQYRLVHHEYSGIANLENPQCDESKYEISREISKYLEPTEKLVVKQLSEAVPKIIITDPLAVVDFLHPSIRKILPFQRDDLNVSERSSWAVNNVVCAAFVRQGANKRVMIWPKKDALVFEGVRNVNQKSNYVVGITSGCHAIDVDGKIVEASVPSRQSYDHKKGEFESLAVSVPPGALFLDLTPSSSSSSTSAYGYLDVNIHSLYYKGTMVGAYDYAFWDVWYLRDLCSGPLSEKCTYVPDANGVKILFNR